MSRRGLSPLKIGVPTLPPVPQTGEPKEIREWAAKLYVELELYFNKMKNQLVDTRGFMLFDQQIVEEGFTIQPTAPYVDIAPPDGITVVTSSPTVAIASGAPNQLLVVTNTGGRDIIMKHLSQTFHSTLADITIPALNCVTYRWAPPYWVQFATL